MSFISIKVAGPTLAYEQVRRLQDCMRKLAVDILGSTAGLTALLIEQVAIQGWSIGAEQALVAVHVEAKVTAGTIEPQQKGRLVAEANALLKQVLGATLPVASCVVIDEIPADAWGYDGLTETRQHQAELPMHAA